MRLCNTYFEWFFGPANFMRWPTSNIEYRMTHNQLTLRHANIIQNKNSSPRLQEIDLCST